MRIERALIPLAFMFLVVGFANKINKEIIIISICCVLLYASGGILNAKIDKDFRVKHVNTIIFLIFAITIILSFSNLIIFFTVLSWIFLSFVYNKYSRFVLFGDIFILGLTHVAIPIISASLILNLDYQLITKLASFMFFSTILIMPIKNINGIKEDKKRGYKTLLTTFRKGKQITFILAYLYFISIFLAYFIFNLSSKFLFILMMILIIHIMLCYTFITNRCLTSYKLSRLIVLLFLFGIVYDISHDINMMIPSVILVAFYSTYLFFGFVGGTK